MREPGQMETLWGLVRKNYPGAQLVPQDNGVAIVTVHSLGVDELSALKQAIGDYNAMEADANLLDSRIDSVMDDLSTRGMSRERHDKDILLLEQAELSLASAIMIGRIAPIRVPHYTREIEELRRKVTTRLMMVAQEMAEREKAKKRAAQKFTHTGAGPMPVVTNIVREPGEGIMDFRRRQLGLA